MPDVVRINFDQFIAKWSGKYCEVAGSANAKNQCVDLANAYIREVLGLTIIEWTNAVDFPTMANKSQYDYIANTPAAVPRKGDIIVWKPTPGHIAIVIKATVNDFTSFDQNFPIGSPCHIQYHTYQNVIGWLRPKNIPVVSPTPPVINIGGVNMPKDKDLFYVDENHKAVEWQVLRSRFLAAEKPQTQVTLNDDSRYDFGSDNHGEVIGTQTLGAVKAIIGDLRRDLKEAKNAGGIKFEATKLKVKELYDFVVSQ